MSGSTRQGFGVISSAVRERDRLDLTLTRTPILSDAQRRTIYALSTPPGKGGIGVVRISGPDAIRVYRAVTRSARSTSLSVMREEVTPVPWVAEYREIIDPETGGKLDDGIVLFFKGPKSFTTEDTLELQVHSGRAVLTAILTALSKLHFCRPAEPGEFTRRAFEGGRMDLTQVEGLRDLIDAETEAQRRIAVSGVGGIQKAKFESLRAKILDCLMYVEGFIDFGEDVDELGQADMLENAHTRAQEIIDTINSHLRDNRRGEILRSGINLAIFGPPNAGKSSLFNFLAERDVAITSPIPGTTRDVLTLTLDIGGLPVVLNDTAGIRKLTDNAIEKIGMERAGGVVEGSDVSICVLSLEEVISVVPSSNQRANRIMVTLPTDVLAHLKPHTIFLFNKADLTRELAGLSGESLERELRDALMRALPVSEKQSAVRVWTVSLRTGERTEEFLDGLACVLKERVAYSELMSTEDAPLITQARHRDYLESAVKFLEEFQEFPLSQIDIAAESLRYAARAIGSVSGIDVSTEDVLGAIFSSFCVGK
ncbi:tRNA modification GTPase TrmE [Pisolithus marmoratus]|nr:tRNA modification GTPase TrmE [Pisolithus marmoratus]